jgi:hypothetical protein
MVPEYLLSTTSPASLLLIPQYLLLLESEHIYKICYVLRISHHRRALQQVSRHLLSVAHTHHWRAFLTRVTLSAICCAYHIGNMRWAAMWRRYMRSFFPSPSIPWVIASRPQYEKLGDQYSGLTVASVQGNVPNTKTQLITRFLTATGKSIHLFLLSLLVRLYDYSSFLSFSLFQSTSQFKRYHREPSKCLLYTTVRTGREWSKQTAVLHDAATR